MLPPEALGRVLLEPPFAAAAQVVDAETTNEDGIPTLVPDVGALVDSLRQLNRVQLGIEDAGAPTAQTGPAGAVHFSEQELVQSLSSLQRQLSTESADAGVSLYDRVATRLGHVDVGKAIHEDQKVTIDVVDRFFASLKHNPRLTPEVKAHLSRLEIPVLKVVLMDEQFFDDRSSSVRGVMNRIAQLGMKGIRLSPMMERRIEGLVQRIVEEFEHDTDIFDQVLNELDALIEKQNELYRKNVERVAAAAEGVHKVEMARRTVAQALNQRLSGRKVPKAVLTLIDNGWKDLLALTYVRQGIDSDDWLEQLQVIDDLLEYSENPEQEVDLQRLLPTIHRGLKQAFGDVEPPSKVREELKALFKSVPSQTQEMEAAATYEVPEPDDDRVRRNAGRLQELKPWVLRAKSFQLGAWMQFNREQEETQYIRLVWVAPGYSKYVFVNHQGRRVVELGLFKLAEYLSDATILPDPDYETPIFNQGLDDMVRDVYDRLAFESTHDRISGWTLRQQFCRDVAQRAQQGPKSASGVLVYLRFEPINSGDDIAPPSEFLQQMVSVVDALPFDDRLCGRIAKRDFAIFVVSDAPDSVASVMGGRLMELCQKFAFGVVRWMVAWGESRAHLGFVNSATMLRIASRPIHSGEESRAGVPTPEHGPSAAVLLTEPDLPTEPDSEAVDTCIERAGEPEVRTADPNLGMDMPTTIDVFMQRAMGLRDVGMAEAQYELIASVPGTGVSYEPLNRQQAVMLDSWWIELLLARDLYPEASWSSLQSVRVELSGYALNDDEFIEWLKSDLTLERLAPLQVWFDVYSCDVIDNVHAAADRMNQLRACGYRFCLDHFGSEQSPFTLLKLMPFDIIKIDESFVRELNQEDADQAAADSVIEVAHYLRKAVLASSVDSAICLQRMRQLKVDYVQGSTIADFEHLLTWEVGGPEAG
jgi:EAL domain-containing protein (putative c-di-GMP-specific phosphodiesterase class I)